MAGSKLFSGDLPEITCYIIQYLRNDLRSLYSCTSVNRLLCRISVPLLWEDPFSARRKGRGSLLDTYFLFFNDDDKEKLKEFGIRPFLLKKPKKPFFKYPSFIKTFNTFRV